MNIVFLEPLGIPKESLKSIISEKVSSEHNITYYDDRITDTESLISRAKDADIVVLTNFKFDRTIMKHCTNLKMICVAFTGIDHIDMDYCKEHNIVVCNCAGYSTVAVADLVFGMVIDLARNILPCNARCREGKTSAGLIGFELEGKTFGIIGLGAIGQRVAKIANAFGCNVIGYNRSKKDIPNVTLVSLDELLKTSDIVSLHVPQTEETIGLIGQNELSMMKPTAMLINTARGPIVDSQALTKALNNGTIACAGIDVFNMEPPLPTDTSILSTTNTVLTPHIAFASHQAFIKRAHIVAENIYSWLINDPQNIIK